MSLTQTDCWNWRNETKRNSKFLFEILSDCLLIWWLKIDDLMCVWLLFFFLSNGVSTFQENEYCKNHSDVKELTDSKMHENRQLTVIFANSRSFSLIHDAHSESEMQSSFSKKEFQTDDFLLTRVFLRVIRRFSFEHSRISTNDENIVSTRSFYEQLTIFFNYSRILTSIFDDFIFLTRVFRRAICFKAERLIECQLISQNSEREICCARNSESSSLRINWKISCWKCAIVTNCFDFVSFYSLIVW